MRYPIRVCVLVMLVLAIFSGTSQATTITFSAAITSPLPPVNEGIDVVYSTPAVLPPTTLDTQGFSFGGFGIAGLFPEVFIMLDPAQCGAATGNPLDSCADNGTPYLATGGPLAMIQPTAPAGTNPLNLFSFDAAQWFAAPGCLGCDPGGVIPSATYIRATGFRAGIGPSVAEESFLLSAAFQTFVLSDPDWLTFRRVVFQGLDANHQPSEGLWAIDNINVTAVPEPGSVLLFGSGALALVRRARRRR